MLKDGADVFLKGTIQEVSTEGRSEIIEMEIMPDHVHLLVEIEPQFGIAKIVTAIKSRLPRLRVFALIAP